jgi:hypothetical protein
MLELVREGQARVAKGDPAQRGCERCVAVEVEVVWGVVGS